MVALPKPSDVSDPFETVKQEILLFITGAVDQIVRGDRAEASVRELAAFLAHLRTIIRRDPALELAADDTLSAASCLAAGLDARRLRILKEAVERLNTRVRMATAART